MNKKTAMTAEQFRSARERLGITQREMGAVLMMAPNSAARKEARHGQQIPVSDRDVAMLKSEFKRRGIAFPRLKKGEKNVPK